MMDHPTFFPEMVDHDVDPKRFKGDDRDGDEDDVAANGDAEDEPLPDHPMTGFGPQECVSNNECCEASARVTVRRCVCASCFAVQGRFLFLLTDIIHAFDV